MLKEKAIIMMQRISHTTGSDLDLGGVSGGFSSLGCTQWDPNGDDISRSSYERPDAHVPLIDGKTLHAVVGGSNEIKLTLVDGTDPSGTKGAELGWVSAKRMKDAIDVNHGLFMFNGITLAFAETPRALKKLLARATLSATS